MRRCAVANAQPIQVAGLAEALRAAGLAVQQLVDQMSDPANSDVSAVLVRVASAEDVARIRSISKTVPDSVIVALLAPVDLSLMGLCFSAGAAACSSIDAQPREIAAAVEAALAGVAAFPRALARELADCLPARAHLSDDEVDWLRCLADGSTVAQLARDAGYSQRELHRRLRRLYTRLGAGSRTEALVRAARDRII